MQPHRHSKLAVRAAVALAAAGVGLYTAAGSLAASGRTAGPVHLFVTPSLTRHGGTLILTGAIGDYGTTFKADAKGRRDQNGTYSQARLRDGSCSTPGR
jgi:hypothetical protein